MDSHSFNVLHVYKEEKCYKMAIASAWEGLNQMVKEGVLVQASNIGDIALRD